MTLNSARLARQKRRSALEFRKRLDSSAVSGVNDAPPIKSIGNSTTSPRDLLTDDDVRVTLRVLSDSVASRLRANRLKCTTVQLEVRNTKLSVYSRQRKLQNASSVSDEIFDTAFSLYLENHPRAFRYAKMASAAQIRAEQEYSSRFCLTTRKAPPGRA